LPLPDLPSGAALLAVARDVLVRDLMPLLPEERRGEALLVARCMAIAEREAAAEETPARELQLFYGVASDSAGLANRFARELRVGAFESSEARMRAARAVLWRLTLARLRRSNPRFLAANGLR
jgi:Domain of unknown function (DUF6285)